MFKLLSAKSLVLTGTLLLLSTTATTAVAEGWSSCAPWTMTKVGYYGIRNNTWGSGQEGAGWQCMWASWGDGWMSWGMDAGHKKGNGLVKGYPQVVRGWSYKDGFRLSQGHGLGVKVPDLNEAKVRWKFSAPVNATYLGLIDVYLHWWHTPGDDESPALNLQLFTYNEDPSGYLTDINRSRGTLLGEKTIGGIKYKAWYRWEHTDNPKMRQLYVRPVTFTKNATHDIKAILDWGKTVGIVSDKMYLTSVQAGWEPIEGGPGFSTSSYWTRVNGK